MPFQLHATGGRVFPVIPLHVTVGFWYGHMIQSKHPPLGPMIDHSKVPVVTTEMVINVELVSPLNKHPEFPGTVLGFVLGLEIDPEVKSTILVAGLFGSIVKAGVVQPGTASEQSFGCANN
jgi:hypothetical protein